MRVIDRLRSEVHSQHGTHVGVHKKPCQGSQQQVPVVRRSLSSPLRMSDCDYAIDVWISAEQELSKRRAVGSQAIERSENTLTYRGA